MKNIYIFLLILGCVGLLKQSALAQGVPLGDYVTTIGPKDTYPTHLDTLGMGGYRSVSDLQARDNITPERRKEGMLVYVKADKTIYKLNTDLTTWAKLDLGGTNGWALNGNAGTNPKGDFIGTKDNAAAVFKANGNEAFRINPAIITKLKTIPANVDFKTTLNMDGQRMLSNGGDAALNNLLVGNTLSGNQLGNGNIAIGHNSGTSYSLSNTVAIGNNAVVNTSNSMILGGIGPDSLNVGINTSSPRTSLDINTTDAIIVPRGTTAQRPPLPFFSFSGAGMLRYNTDDKVLEYHDHASWQSLSSGWSLKGNSGISSSSNFIGTTDLNPVIFKANDREALRLTFWYNFFPILGFGVNMGINTSSPRASLDINTKDAIVLPTGGNFDRPGGIGAVPGMLRFNSDKNVLEYRDNNSWRQPVVAVNPKKSPQIRKLSYTMNVSSYPLIEPAENIVLTIPVPNVNNNDKIIVNPQTNLNAGMVIASAGIWYSDVDHVNLIKIVIYNGNMPLGPNGEGPWKGPMAIALQPSLTLNITVIQ